MYSKQVMTEAPTHSPTTPPKSEANWPNWKKKGDMPRTARYFPEFWKYNSSN